MGRYHTASTFLYMFDIFDHFLFFAICLAAFLQPAKLARAAVPTTLALLELVLGIAVPPRRLGAVWLTGPGEARKAVPAAPNKAAPTAVCAMSGLLKHGTARYARSNVSMAVEIRCSSNAQHNLVQQAVGDTQILEQILKYI